MLLEELLNQEREIKRNIKKLVKEYYETENKELYSLALILTKDLSKLEKETRKEMNRIKEKNDTHKK